MKKYIQSAEGLTSKQRVRIAKNSTDPRELKRLAYDNARSVRLTVLNNPNTPNNVAQMLCDEFANDGDVDVRMARARRTDDPNLLDQLANDRFSGVRLEVAKNPNVTEETLAQLANDEDPVVRRRVAENPNTPADILAQLANDPLPYIYIAVAENPNVTEEILNQL